MRLLSSLLGMAPESKARQPVTLSIQGGPQVETQGLVMDLILDGNIGVSLLKDWVVTLDLANQRAWIAKR